MASKLKTTQLRRKDDYERKLKNRMALLAERKVEPARIEKDPIVKSLRGNIEATQLRLKAIAKIEQRTAELAKMKAEKAEAAKAAKAPAPEEGGKEKAKGKKKEAPAEGLEKKEKKEKKKKEEKAE